MTVEELRALKARKSYFRSAGGRGRGRPRLVLFRADASQPPFHAESNAIVINEWIGRRRLKMQVETSRENSVLQMPQPEYLTPLLRFAAFLRETLGGEVSQKCNTM